MPYSTDNIKTVSDAFEKKRADAERGAELRREELYKAVPKIREIDETLSVIGYKTVTEAFSGGASSKERIAAMKKEADELRSARREYMKNAGFAEDYDEIRRECPVCLDTGYLKNGSMCKCFKRELIRLGVLSSGMAKLISKQSFDNFDLSYYTGSDRALMEKNLTRIKSFASDISCGKYRNMMFIGTTGLGKTHLSSAVAHSVIEGGCDVVYESVQNIISDFERERFFRSYGDSSPSKTDKYFSCDLLIIDDLGVEVSSQFTVSCLYNLLNTRIVNEKSMLISTNVTKEELLDRYADRILSRLFGEFEICIFSGTDIRSQKLKK